VVAELIAGLGLEHGGPLGLELAAAGVDVLDYWRAVALADEQLGWNGPTILVSPTRGTNEPPIEDWYS